MMLNYMKGEAFRIVRGKEVYLLAGILSLLAIADVPLHLKAQMKSSPPSFGALSGKL